MDNKKQMLKQLKFAKKLMLEIKSEHDKEHFLRFGKFAYDIQRKEYLRLKKLYEKTIDNINSYSNRLRN